MKPYQQYFFPTVFLLASNGALAADQDHGKSLYKENCTSCHIQMTGGDGSTLFTRKDRKVDSLESLDAQVRRCQNNLNLLWFDEDVADVVAYLNSAYYKLGGE